MCHFGKPKYSNIREDTANLRQQQILASGWHPCECKCSSSSRARPIGTYYGSLEAERCHGEF